MEKQSTISEIILQNAKEIMMIEGPKALTMRNIAKKSGIALGTAYNYYKTKDEIVLALVQSHWESALVTVQKRAEREASFSEQINNLYIILYEEFSQFHNGWMGLIRSIDSKEKETGRKKMTEVQQYLYRYIHQLLEAQLTEKGFLLNESLTSKEFSEFICKHLLAMLMQNEKEINTLITMIELVFVKEK